MGRDELRDRPRRVPVDHFQSPWEPGPEVALSNLLPPAATPLRLQVKGDNRPHLSLARSNETTRRTPWPDSHVTALWPAPKPWAPCSALGEGARTLNRLANSSDLLGKGQEVVEQSLLVELSACSFHP